MLIKDPVNRPSMRRILEKEFLSRRISKLLTTTIAKNEFSNTFVEKHLKPQHSEQPEGKNEEEQKDDSTATNQQPPSDKNMHPSRNFYRVKPIPESLSESNVNSNEFS